MTTGSLMNEWSKVIPFDKLLVGGVTDEEPDPLTLAAEWPACLITGVAAKLTIARRSAIEERPEAKRTRRFEKPG
jgi:hypothetical protein